MTGTRFAWWGDDEATKALCAFHRELNGETADKAGRAALRRARTPQEAALVPVVGVLRRAIRDKQIKISDDDIDTAAILVAEIGTDWQQPQMTGRASTDAPTEEIADIPDEAAPSSNLAHGGPDRRGFSHLARCFAERLAVPNSNGKPASPERVRLLLSTEDAAEFLRLLRALLDLLDRTAPLTAVIETTRRWSRQGQRAETRAAIARPYYELVAPALLKKE